MKKRVYCRRIPLGTSPNISPDFCVVVVVFVKGLELSLTWNIQTYASDDFLPFDVVIFAFTFTEANEVRRSRFLFCNSTTGEFKVEIDFLIGNGPLRGVFPVSSLDTLSDYQLLLQYLDSLHFCQGVLNTHSIYELWEKEGGSRCPTVRKKGVNLWSEDCASSWSLPKKRKGFFFFLFSFFF